MNYDEIGTGPRPLTPLVPMILTPEPAYYEPDEDDSSADFADYSADLSGELIAQPTPAGLLLPAGARTVAGTNEATEILRALGWRIRTTGERVQVVRNFQRSWALGPALAIDGLIGPRTTAALRLSEARRRKHLPTASVHFSFAEYACKCGGRYTGCARVWTNRTAILMDEKYRKALGHGFSIVSGCRCVNHNAAVGGVPHSRHLLGDARDFSAEHPPGWFTTRSIYRGHGYNRSNGLVRHGDLGAVRSWIYS